MRKPLSILLMILFVASAIIPVLPHASPLTTHYVNQEPYYRCTVAYKTYGNYAIFAYILANYKTELLIVDNNGNVVLNQTLNTDAYTYSDLDIAPNDTGVLLAYTDYNGGDKDIHLQFIKYDGSVIDIGIINHTSGAKEVNPVVAFGGNYWFLAYLNDTGNVYTVMLFDKSFNPIYISSLGNFGSQGGIDYRERAFYYNGKFYLVVKDKNAGTGNYELALLEVDPTGPSVQEHWLTDSSAVEGNPYNQKLYRRFYAKLMTGAGKLLVVYGYYSGGSTIDGLIVDLATMSITPVSISGEGGDSNFYPWIAVNGTYNWLVVWSYNNNIYAKFIYPDGTTSNTFTLAAGNYGFVTTVFNGQDYTIIYGNQTSGNYAAYAMRIETHGKRSTPFKIAETPGDNIQDYFPLFLGTNHIMLYHDDTAGTEYMAVFGVSEVPEPTKIPTKITWQLIENSGADGFLEAGESVNVTGYLIDAGTGLGVSGKTITATLYMYNFYNNEIHHDEPIAVASATGTTNSSGGYNIEINIPADALSNTYYVQIDFAGDDTYSAQSNVTTDFLIFHAAPVEPSWVTVPGDITAGPALLVSNGQIVITDPQGDERVDIINGTGEEGDVYIRTLWLGFDQNYLYIKAEFTGDTTPTGSITPALAFALDFTPDNPSDGWGHGYTGNFKLVYGSGWDSETHINNSRAWDVDFVITPVYPQMYNDSGKIPVFLYVAFEDGGRWYYRELLTGYSSFSGNTITAYLPLDIIRQYNPHLATSGNQSIMLFSAVFAVNVTEDKLVSGTPFANWYDVPGALTAGITPSSYLNQGFNESYSDNKKTYHSHKSWELDTRFILNMNLDTGKFYGTTKLWVDNTTVNGAGFSTNKVRAYVGTNTYNVRVIDNDNPLYYVYGKTVNMLVNNTAAASAASDALGLAAVQKTWASSDWKKTANINFTFPGDADYVGSSTTTFTTRVLYLINITGLSYKFYDLDHDGYVSRGDKIVVTASVQAWDGSNWVTAPDGIGVRFFIHSPDVPLGTAYTSGGNATLPYTFTGNEGLSGTHSITALGDPATSYTTSAPGAQVQVTTPFFVFPAPEPPILPVILLAAILLFIIIKKRK